MEYVLYTYNNGQLVDQDSSLEEVIQSRVAKLTPYFSTYVRKPKLEIRVSFEKEEAVVSYLIKMRSRPVFIDDRGKDVIKLANKMFDQIESEIENQQRLEHKALSKSRKRWQIAGFNEHLETLNRFRQQDDKNLFVHLLQSLMPDIKAYMIRQYKRAFANSDMPHERRIDYQDLFSEFYLKVFEDFDQKPQERDQVVDWLYGKADDLLKERFSRLNIEVPGTISYEEIMKARTKEMEERFTTDAEGELIMLEELDEYNSYSEFDDIVDESKE